MSSIATGLLEAGGGLMAGIWLVPEREGGGEAGAEKVAEKGKISQAVGEKMGWDSM